MINKINLKKKQFSKTISAEADIVLLNKNNKTLFLFSKTISASAEKIFFLKKMSIENTRFL